MKLVVPKIRSWLERHPVMLTVVASIAAFGTYSCMYAFRKSFAAGTFAGNKVWGIDYKVCLVLAQVLGYMLSKFWGIKMISGLKQDKRAFWLVTLILSSWLALLLFAIIPAPYNIGCLLLNGFPLGMIWGIVFSYIEGRRATELMGTIMAVSLVFSSGVVKTAGKYLLIDWHIPEAWMPFGVGLLFIMPLVIFLFFLEQLPPPNADDIAARAIRVPMTGKDRKQFIRQYLPGIVLIVVVYLMMTIVRDIRDNFEVEIWSALGYGNQPSIFTRTDIPIAFMVLFMMGLLILIKNNLAAFTVIHVMILTGCLIAGVGTWLYDLHFISGFVWMTSAGLGLYMAYIPYNCIFFERMIATFRITGNVGFIMYIADAFGYLGSISVLVTKEVSKLDISWLHFFHASLKLLSVTGFLLVAASLLYFRLKANKNVFIKTPLKTTVYV